MNAIYCVVIMFIMGLCNFWNSLLISIHLVLIEYSEFNLKLARLDSGG